MSGEVGRNRSINIRGILGFVCIFFFSNDLGDHLRKFVYLCFCIHNHFIDNSSQYLFLYNSFVSYFCFLFLYRFCRNKHRNLLLPLAMTNKACIAGLPVTKPGLFFPLLFGPISLIIITGKAVSGMKDP